MISIRRAATRGVIQSGPVELDCYFSFATSIEPGHEHEGRLRVVNAGHIPAGQHYTLGAEQEMDILTWVEHGVLTTSVEGLPDEAIQGGGLHAVSTAGGCRSLDWHARADTTFFQFWVLPDTEGGEPTQEVRPAPAQADNSGFRIVASGFPEDDPEETQTVTDGAPLTLRARARLLHAEIVQNEGAAYSTTPGRALYLVVVSGQVSLGDALLAKGDAAALENETSLVAIARETSVVLLVDAPL
ncbi:hypothetical protein K2X14_12435 [Acetobacter sp. TBRC 12305]|uniref:Quercetin 2,3-dioxygenase C-terminal cupin domain-containing protein n=1 Tax=Acetobacter garciniae TaxID=2817435 RepID=A0A939KNI9_9PROT|nr:hypothetical protein [Acetobacter garciniae]MBO1325750.1 hypothetical protein [Acetobacter garciniae]MBX0345650.1 hypothetical protein [Acetobacter garciniae]